MGNWLECGLTPQKSMMLYLSAYSPAMEDQSTGFREQSLCYIRTHAFYIHGVCHSSLRFAPLTV